MRKLPTITMAGLLALGGCAQKNASAPAGLLGNAQTATMADPSAAQGPAPVTPGKAGDVVALVNGKAITREQLQGPVFEAYGLQFLLNLVQLEMARQRAAEIGADITPADVRAERLRTLESLFKDSVDRTMDEQRANWSDEEKEKYRRSEYERLLVPFLSTSRISMTEFELATRTSAYLRKVAESQINKNFEDKVLEEAFRIKYGAKVLVRHIQVPNLLAAAEVRRELDNGADFTALAKLKSTDQKSKDAGGLIRPFSLAERWWPQAFKEAAFALKNEGDLSDIVQTGDATYHIIRLEKKIPPVAVKFEDHKEILRLELYNLMVGSRMTQLRRELAMEADRVMKIEDPVLRRQYVERMERAKGETAHDPRDMSKTMELQRKPPAPQDNTSTSGGASTPGRDEVARPPATRPGE